VKLKSYRVFADGNLAPNFSIAKAIDKAVTDDKCDILNLSFTLQSVGDDPAVRAALEDARAAGVLPIAAAGNDYRQPVGFPARDSMCIAVTALGRRDIIADGSIEVADVIAPYGSDANDFIAAFSNLGPEVDATAPGSGVVSTVPTGYGVLSGTSMACPVVVGLAARLLSRDQQLLNMPRNPNRSAGLAQLLLSSAGSLGFAAELQGAGLVQMQAEV
jgi:subtilisin